MPCLRVRRRGLKRSGQKGKEERQALLPKKPRALPRKEEVASESDDPKRVSQMRMYKGPVRVLSSKSSFHGAIRAEVRAPGAGVERTTKAGRCP